MYKIKSGEHASNNSISPDTIDLQVNQIKVKSPALANLTSPSYVSQQSNTSNTKSNGLLSASSNSFPSYPNPIPPIPPEPENYPQTHAKSMTSSLYLDSEMKPEPLKTNPPKNNSAPLPKHASFVTQSTNSITANRERFFTPNSPNTSPTTSPDTTPTAKLAQKTNTSATSDHNLIAIKPGCRCIIL